MDRIVVVGNSGSGKTSVAREVSRLLGVAHVELDAIFHQPGWTEPDVVEFRRLVTAAVVLPRWIVDGNYGDVRDIIWERADTVVWLDLPRWLVTRRVVGRTARRWWRREELWNGNRESLRNSLSWNPERSIVRWSWTQHATYRQRYSAATRDPAFAHITFHRLRTSHEVAAFIAAVRRDAA